MRFVKGQSANPGGRPKALKEIQALAQQHTPKAIEALEQIMREGKSDQARVAAANALLDRAYGKPPQAVPAEASGHLTVSWLDE